MYLMLLISTIVVVCNHAGRRQTIERERARVPLLSAADRHAQILVLGIVTVSGVKPVTPASFFSLFEVEELRV